MGNEDDPFNRFKKSGKSCKKSADPCAKSDDPCTKSEDPCTKSDDLRTKSDDLCTKSDDPCAKSDDLCASSAEIDPCKSTCDSDSDPCDESRVSSKETIDPCESDSSSWKNTCDPYPNFPKPKQSPCPSPTETIKRPSIFPKKSDSSKKSRDKDLQEDQNFQAKFKKYKIFIPSALKSEEGTKKDPKKSGTVKEKDLEQGEKFKAKFKKFNSHIPSALKSEETAKKTGNKLQECIKKCGVMQKLGPAIKGSDPKTMIKNAFTELKKFFKLQQKGGSTPPDKKMADKAPGPPSRPMKFPYTFSAKIAQFPLGYYIKNQWIWRYYFISVAACLPVFYSIHKLANSPANVSKWAELRRKEAEEHH